VSIPSFPVTRQTDTVIKRGPRFDFCRFSVFFFRPVLAKEASFGHVFFVVTPIVLAMPASLRVEFIVSGNVFIRSLS